MFVLRSCFEIMVSGTRTPSDAAPICHSCGRNNHKRAECKFGNAACHACGKVGHISKVCRSTTSTASVRQVSNGSHSESDAIVLTVSSSDSVGKLCYKQFNVGSAHIKFLMDSGSQVTLLPKDLLSRTGLRMSTNNIPRITAYGGSKISVVGLVNDVSFSHAGKSHVGRIVITEECTTPILGMDYLVPLGLLQFQSNPIAYDDHSFIASFRLKKDISFDGMCHAPRSLPFSMKAIVETEILRLLKEDIIYPVQSPTMSAPIVPVIKEVGAKRPIRICGDYSVTLNKVIDPDSYRLPRLEEIMERISGAQVYSVLDLTDAYLQIPLSEDSQRLTSVSTHIGHFAYKRLQFGISAAPLIFQEIMDKVLADISYVSAYQDDIIIGAPNQQVHTQTLNAVLARLQKYGFKINDAKSRIALSEVKFLGFVLRAGKLVPDKERLKAFSNLAMPSSKDQLRSLLGTLRHYGLFCKNFSAIARPLYTLLKTNVQWKWTDHHTQSVRRLLDSFSEGAITCYDQKKPLFVFSDASKNGLGFVLAHDIHQKEIVWLGSRVLSSAESNYSNIEREALGVIEAVKYFHKFIAGRRFTICSDHQPLQFIFNNKSVPDRVSARLQRWAITLRAYDYEVHHVRGEVMYSADTLSRIPRHDSQSLVPTVNLLNINSIQDFVQRESLLSRIASSSDASLSRLKKYIVFGWPKNVPAEMLPYAKSKEEYSIQDGIIFRGLRIVPPTRLRSHILHILHTDHTGITRMLKLARQYFWWPKVDSDINAIVQRCATCQIHAR